MRVHDVKPSGSEGPCEVCARPLVYHRQYRVSHEGGDTFVCLGCLDQFLADAVAVGFAKALNLLQPNSKEK